MKVIPIFNYLTIFLFLIVPNIFAQDFSFRVKGSYAEFNMSDLKNAQKEVSNTIINTFDIPIKNVESFPSFYSFELQLALFKSKNINSGILYGFSSTGARSIYSDYSGEYKIDYLINANNYGAFVENNIQITPIHSIIIGGKLLVINSSLEIDTHLSIGSNSNSMVEDFESSSFGINPYIAYQVSYGILHSRVEIEYLNDFGKEIHLKDNEDANLIIKNNGEKIYSNWSGLRFGLSIGINLTSSK